MNPFDFVNSVSHSKIDIMQSDLDEKEYAPYLVNKALSYHPDTVLYANEMNTRHSIDNKLQYQYYLNIIRPKKRFAKWVKKTDSRELDYVKRYYDYSDEKAEQVLSLLSTQQLNIIKQRLNEGGTK